MNRTDAVLQTKLRRFLQNNGRDLTLGLVEVGAYVPATGTSSNTSTEVTVRGRLYVKRTRQFIEGQPIVETSRQKAVIEARGLSRAPQKSDYLLVDDVRYAIVESDPQQGAEIVLSYQLTLEQI